MILAMVLVRLALADDSLSPFPSNRSATADSAIDSGRESDQSCIPGGLKEYQLGATVVKGVRRHGLDAAVDASVWTKPSAMGLPGALESLREQPGVAFSGDLSGHFSSTGMPVEGSAVTWEGAEILWPWHFGGLFGALDDRATGKVDWRASSGGSSPARGGGWLETRSRAWGDSDQVHAAARLGFVAGGAATWGRRGDWGWQLTGRRTWLGAALGLAKDQGWTDQEMSVMFQDGTAELTWRHGAWDASVGWFGSEDSLGIRYAREAGGAVGLSWRNLAIPLRLGWKDGPWSTQTRASWSRYRRVDSDFGTVDTLGVFGAGLEVSRSLEPGLSLQAGLKLDRWSSSRGSGDGGAVPTWTGDSDRVVVEPHLGVRLARSAWVVQAWGGVASTGREPAVPQGGLLVGCQLGRWGFEAGAERKVVVLSILDQGQAQIDAASPAWILAPGPSARTTQIHAQVRRIQNDPEEGLETRLLGLGWFRIGEGFWNWTPVRDRIDLEEVWNPSRSDGWSAGLELDGSICLRRLEIGGRQILSMDVLRDRASPGFQPASRWAPWDQRWRTELRASWGWRGPIRPRPGQFHWMSELVGKMSTGLPRGKYLARTLPDRWRDVDTTYVVGENLVYGKVRTPYLRVDFTPLRMGREGAWSCWWTLVNVANQTNLMGWSFNGGATPDSPVSQIPLLPVVFGVQVEI